MFAPASFFKSGGWPGPYVLLGAEGVGLTWALGLPSAAMRYLDEGMRSHWEAAGNLRAAALANLDRVDGGGDPGGLVRRLISLSHESRVSVETAQLH